MKQFVYITGVFVGVAVITTIITCGSGRIEPGAVQPFNGSRAVGGLLSGGMVDDVQWSDPVIVTVPDEWQNLRDTAKQNYLRAIWEAGPDKADVHVVDRHGNLLQTYTPPVEPEPVQY